MSGYNGFWTQPCPVRSAPDLRHKHDIRCEEHAADQCCECGQHSRETPPPTTPPPAPDNRPPADHIYVFTIAGRCARCQRTSFEHPSFLKEPDPMTECQVDHYSLSTKLNVVDGGEQWSRCPQCNVQVEPKSLSGMGATGPSWGPGRGSLAPRTEEWLRGWAGWVAFNGGD